MSLSPRLSPPSNVSPNVNGASNPNSELASILSNAYHEIDALKRDLSATRKRAEKAERLVHTLNQSLDNLSSTNGSSSQPLAHQLILEYEERILRAEIARDEAECRRQVVNQAWHDIDRYFTAIELQAQDIRAGMRRIVNTGGGQLVLTSLPQPTDIQQPVPFVSPPLNMPPPPMHHSSQRQQQHHLPPPTRSSHNHRTQAFPSLPLPPPPNPHPTAGSSRVRPRTGSLDGMSGSPPVKKSRGEGERSHRDDRSMFSDSVSHSSDLRQPHQHHQHHQSRISTSLPSFAQTRIHGPSSEPFELIYANMPRHRQSSGSGPGIPRSRHRHRHHARSYSRSRSRSRSRESSRSSLSIDEMLLEATTTKDNIERERGTGSDPGSARRLSPAISRTGSASASGRGGGGVPQMTTYQTHIFATPVTGAPVKKSKYNQGSIADGGANSRENAGGMGPVPSSTATGMPNGHSLAVPVQPQQSFTSPNALNQRVCRQCGLAGRYKDGKCVEKWGPGPEGPGTVCDRCRKKMKRVERRSTLDNSLHPPIPAHLAQRQTMTSRRPSVTQQQMQLSPTSTRSVHRTETLPVVHPISPVTSLPFTQRESSTSYNRPSPATSVRPSLKSPLSPLPTEPPHESSEAPASSPETHILPNAKKPVSRKGSQHPASSSNEGSPAEALGNGKTMKAVEKRPSHHRQRGTATQVEGEEGEVDADGDAEGDAEADVDPVAEADAELLEAVDAAEANTEWLKEEDA